MAARPAATLLVWLVALVGGLWTAGVPGAAGDRATVFAEAKAATVDAGATLEPARRPAAGHVEAPASSPGLSGLVSRGSPAPDRATHSLPMLSVAQARTIAAAPPAATRASARTRAAATRGGVLPYYPTAPPAGR